MKALSAASLTPRHWLLLPLLLVLLSACAALPSVFADAPPADARYPRLPLVLLKDDQRARFVTLAQGELCPCDGALDSLDACLQRDDGGCRLALQVAKGAMRKMREGESDSDIGDYIIQEVQRAKKVYTFDLKDTPWKGADPANAKVTIVEYADFQCPFCARAAEALDALAQGPGVTIYFKQYPLKMHEHARAAALASLAAHRQGKFWPMHDALMSRQGSISPANIKAWAKELGLDMARFEADVASPALEAIINADVLEADDFDLTGTPTIFLNGVRFEGSLEELRDAVAERAKE
jgi:protein-disulfide isomerase